MNHHLQLIDQIDLHHDKNKIIFFQRYHITDHHHIFQIPLLVEINYFLWKYLQLI